MQKISKKVRRKIKRVGKRTPPIGKLLLSPVFIAGFVVYVALNLMLWLVGFYECKRCDRVHHVFKQPKWEVLHVTNRGMSDWTEVVCAECGEKDKMRERKKRLRPPLPGVTTR